MYQAQKNRGLSLFIDPKEKKNLFAICSYSNEKYFAQNQAMHRLKHFEVHWPRMREDVHYWVQSYEQCIKNPPLPYAYISILSASQSKMGTMHSELLAKQGVPKNNEQTKKESS